MDLPAGYTLQSMEKDSVSFTIDATHTVLQPHLVIIDRRIPSYNAGNQAFSQPTYRLRVIRGNVDVDNLPISQRTMCDLEFRWIAGQASADLIVSLTTPLNAVLALSGFAADVFDKQSLPVT